jgi:multidrug efflux pump subunit AcrB
VLQARLDEFEAEGRLPDGYTLELDGESSSVNDMVSQIVEILALGLLLVYLIMVAQFQNLLSPFIVLFTIPLAFTGGLIGLILTGQQLSMMSLMGFVVLMGTVVNNGIVFVDYANQLRIGGLERREALVATGQTRMRAILMTAMTTILAMVQLAMTDDMAGQLMSGMAIVIIGGMTYATLMTLYVVPLMYDLLSRRPPLQIDVGGDELDDVPDDAAEYLSRQTLYA